MRNLVLLFTAIALISCAKEDIDYSYPDDPENKRKTRAGKFFDDEVVLFGQKNQDKKYEVSDNKLFESAKTVISSLMKIDVSDSELGLISTKWKLNKSKDEITKLTAIVKGINPQEENIKISIQKKKKIKSGKWKSIKSENEDMLIKLLKEKIISRAKS